MCSSDVDKTKGYPERENKEEWKSPFILMVDRGSCTFVTKVRNAQAAGAAAVVIADNTCLCSDMECMTQTDADRTRCENTEPIMADDGSGGDISIPAFLMFKHDADPVKAVLKKNQVVQIEMSWSLPSNGDTVTYDVWSSPPDTVSQEFFQKWKPLAKALGDKAKFSPHMYIHNGSKMGCQGTDGKSFCYTLCTNGGRYCATDPDNDLEKGASGADVVRESLRRLCVWDIYGEKGGGEFWDYVAEFYDRCTGNYFGRNECIKDVYKHSKVDGDKVDACIKESGGVRDDDGSNKKLSAEILSQEQHGVVVIPSAFVNDAVIRGSLTPTNVLTAICAGFSDGTAPDVCRTCGNCRDASECAETGECKAGFVNGGPGGNSSSSVSKHTYFSSMFMLVAIFSLLGAWHYKRTQDNMREQVRGILADYLPLEDQYAPPGGGPMDFARGTSLMS